MSLTLNAIIEYFDWTPRPVIVYHEIRFAYKRIVGSEDIVETVISEKKVVIVQQYNVYGNSSTIQHLW